MRWLFCLLIVFFVNCAFLIKEEEEIYKELNQCSSDVDCNEFGYCDEELLSCISSYPLKNGRELFVEVVPQDSSNSKYYLIESLFPQSDEISIELRDPIKVEGAITFTDENGETQFVEALIKFIPKIKTHYTPDFSTNSFSGSISEQKNYSIELPQGIYSITIQPLNEWKDIIPPYYEENITLSSTNSYTISHNYEQNNLRKIEGIINLPTSIRGNFIVSAFDLATKKQISTTYEIECKDIERDNCGYFFIAMESKYNEFGLRILPSQDERSTKYLPVMELLGFKFEDNDINNDGRLTPEELYGGSILLTDLEYLTKLKGSIVGLDAEETPIRNARVKIISKEINSYGGLGNIQLNVLLLSDDKGRFEIPLIPGDYVINITVDTTSRFTSKSFSITIREEEEIEETFYLPLKPIMDFEIYTKIRNKPIPNATINLTHLVLGSTFQAVTGMDGKAAINLDEGEYLLEIVPPENSHLPWYVGKIVTSQDSSSLSRTVIYISPPFVLRGTIIGSSSNYLVNLYYPFYLNDDNVNLIKISSTKITDDSGEFILYYQPVESTIEDYFSSF